MLPGRFAIVLAIRGQECPVSLHGLFRRFVAFPDEFPETVSRFLDEMSADGLDSPFDHDFADAATAILPQVRSRAWLEAQGGVFGDGALVHRRFSEDLVICYVIDESWCMTFVCQAHLKQWNIGERDLYHLATRNLDAAVGADVPVPEQDGEPVLLRTGDGFDAARVLLLDPERVEGLLVAMPERDVLWLGREQDDGLGELMSRNQEQSQASAHPISPHLYRVRDGELVQVTEDDTAR